MKSLLITLTILVVSISNFSVNAFQQKSALMSLPPRQGRIVCGEDGEYKPYHVTITAQNALSSKTGAGIIISGRHILTVATLIRFYTSWTIGYGEVTLEKLQNVTSNFAFIHPLYDESTAPQTSDIGVIILTTSLGPPISDIYPIGPIDFPTMIMELPRINEEGTIVGMSSDSNGQIYPNSTLKSAYLLVQPKSKCSSTTNDTFCAANEYFDENVCHTDAGGAFAIHYRGGIALAGMTISSSNTCNPAEISIFLRIQSYVPWLEAVTYGAL